MGVQVWTTTKIVSQCTQNLSKKLIVDQPAVKLENRLLTTVPSASAKTLHLVVLLQCFCCYRFREFSLFL